MGSAKEVGAMTQNTEMTEVVRPLTNNCDAIRPAWHGP